MYLFYWKKVLSNVKEEKKVKTRKNPAIVSVFTQISTWYQRSWNPCHMKCVVGHRRTVVYHHSSGWLCCLSCVDGGFVCSGGQMRVSLCRVSCVSTWSWAPDISSFKHTSLLLHNPSRWLDKNTRSRFVAAQHINLFTGNVHSDEHNRRSFEDCWSSNNTEPQGLPLAHFSK